MMINLDDVMTLLHIPVTRATISFLTLKIDEVNDLLVQLLGVTEIEAAKEDQRMFWTIGKAVVVKGSF
ncbi:hypothetical protein CRYUN_Cryun15aG0071600 [Craigia yunnanensis]